MCVRPLRSNRIDSTGLNLHFGGGALSFYGTWGQIFNSKSSRTQRRKSTKRALRVSFWLFLTAGSCSQPNKSTASGTRQPQRGRLPCVFRVAQGQMCNKNIICHRYFLQKLSVCWALSWIPHLRPPWGAFVSSLNPNNRLFLEAQSLLRHTRRTLFFSGAAPRPPLLYQTIFLGVAAAICPAELIKRISNVCIR